MKKIILVLSLVISSISLFSLDHGLISGFDIGYDYYNRTALHEDNRIMFVDYDNSISLKLATGYRIESFRLIGEYTNLVHPLEIDNYNPSQDTFTIRMNYTYKYFKVELYHTCSHSLTTNGTTNDVTMDKTYRGINVSYYREF